MPEILAPRGALRRGDPHLHTSISDSLLLPSKTVLAAAEAGMHWSAISFLHAEKEPDLVDVAKWTRDENGVMLIAHPNQLWLISFPLWGVRDAISKIRDKGIEVALGLEVVTASRKVFPHFLRRNASFAVLNKFAKEQGLAVVASSDTHVRRLIGKAYTNTFADRVIKTEEDEYANVQQAFKNLDTWPVTIHYSQMSFMDVTLLRAEMGIVELLKLVGRYFIKENESWDPFYGGRWLESKLGFMSSADFELTQKIKKVQEAYRQQVFKEDGIDQHIRTRE